MAALAVHPEPGTATQKQEGSLIITNPMQAADKPVIINEPVIVHVAFQR